MTIDFNTLFPTRNIISANGIIRTMPADFKVTELNDITLAGEGEHLWLYIQKTGNNSIWVSKKLANICQVPQKQVAFAGQKDRHAITKQWFSVQLPKISDPEKIQSAFEQDIKILKSKKHNRKIKTGQLEANAFEIVIRNIQGNNVQIEKNIQSIKDNGAPNYFGPQRFGHDMGNIAKCQDWFSGTYKVKSRNLKSLLISTARSHIFNLIIAKRLEQKIWDKCIRGDILQLDKTHSWFPSSDASEAEIIKRLNGFDIHITAAMWGEDQVQSRKDCSELENTIAQQLPIYQQGFEKFRLKQDRRAMRVYPINFNHNWQSDNTLQLKFELFPGTYATTIMREILAIKEAI